MDMASGAGEAPRPVGYAAKARRGSFFQIYKPGQGYYTRLGTAVFFGALVLWAAHFAYMQMAIFHDPSVAWTTYLRYGVPVAVLVGFGLLLYWIVGVTARTIDFFIQTEGEMKKVSWSSRREVIGSTKVVIGTVVILSAILFVVDLLFMLFFDWIGVLHGPNLVKRLFGMGE